MYLFIFSDIMCDGVFWARLSMCATIWTHLLLINFIHYELRLPKYCVEQCQALIEIERADIKSTITGILMLFILLTDDHVTRR